VLLAQQDASGITGTIQRSEELVAQRRSNVPQLDAGGCDASRK
jgi:hypothetical protein